MQSLSESSPLFPRNAPKPIETHPDLSEAHSKAFNNSKITAAFENACAPQFAPPASYTGGNPSAENMFDDETGDALYQRSDDTKEALKTRLQRSRART